MNHGDDNERLLIRRVSDKVILHAIRKLVTLPHQGHRRSDLTSGPLRFQTIRDRCTGVKLIRHFGERRLKSLLSRRRKSSKKASPSMGLTRSLLISS